MTMADVDALLKIGQHYDDTDARRYLGCCRCNSDHSSDFSKYRQNTYPAINNRPGRSRFAGRSNQLPVRRSLGGGGSYGPIAIDSVFQDAEAMIANFL